MEPFIPEGITDPATLEVFKNPDVQAALLKSIDAREAPLRAKKDELLGAHTTLNDELKKLGGLEAGKAAIAKASKAESEAEKARLDALKAAGNVDEITKHYQKQLKDAQEETTKYKTTTVKKQVNLSVAEAIRKANGVPELLSDRLMSRVKGSLNDDGDVVLQVLDPAGAPMLLAGGKTATIDDLVEEFRNNEVYGRAFNASGKSGSGGKASDGITSSGENPFDKKSKDFNITKAMALRKANPIKALQLAAEAGWDTSSWPK